MPTKTNIAFCAGLYEGEGTIVTQLGGKSLKDGSKGAITRQITLSIAMTDRYPLELFDDIMGVGTIFGPYTYKMGNKPAHVYRVTSYEYVQFVVCQMWFWLSPRRKEQIEKAFIAYKAITIKYPNRSWRRN